MANVSKAVILAAGLGTRMLPATKVVPKEMLTIVDRPLVQYAVEEVVAAGIREIVFVTADGKEAIRDHFSRGGRTEHAVRAGGNAALADSLDEIAQMADFAWVKQPEARGIAHAVACAREHLEGAPFVLLFPDDLLLAERSVVAQMLDAYSDGSMIAVHEVADRDVPQYGIVDPVDDANPARLRGIIEKPALEQAPSRLGVVGRYVLGDTIFEHIDRITPGKNGELQLTDALARQVSAGELVTGFRYDGERYDTGRPLGLIVANTAAALRRPEMAPALASQLREMLGQGER